MKDYEDKLWDLRRGIEMTTDTERSFRDAIEKTINGIEREHSYVDSELMADAVMALPEMQAIRRLLRAAFVDPYVDTLNPTRARLLSVGLLTDGGLTPSVVAWVLNEPEEAIRG